MSTCSSSKKHVIICRKLHQLYDDDNIPHSRCKMMCVPCHSLTNKDDKELPTSQLLLPYSKGFDIRFGTAFICIGPAIYFFGGIHSEGDEDVTPDDDSDFLLNKVFKYNLRKLPAQVGPPSSSTDMPARMFYPLLVHGGDDTVYALNYGRAADGCRKPTLQRFSCKRNEWSIVGDADQVVDILERCDAQNQVSDKIHRLPHVVIGHKIHLSLGHSSFTFDTVTHTWKTCKLFRKFWSKQKKAKSGLSPTDFYGRNVCYMALDEDTKKRKKRKRNKLVGGPPFVFHGRGLVWDNDILLGVHYAKHCPLVAFLLDRKGRVVRSQPITLNNLELDVGIAFDRYWARIVDLGGGGCFGLVHARSDMVFTGDVDDFDGGCIFTINLELVTFRLKKLNLDNADEDDFLECEVIRKDIIEKGMGHTQFDYDVFCV